jgi:hypothetical protein
VHSEDWSIVECISMPEAVMEIDALLQKSGSIPAGK